MEYDDNKLVLKKNNFKFNLLLLKIVLLILSFIMGSVLILFVLKYLNNITILNTFLILLYIYFFQLVVEIIKYFIVYIENKNLYNNVLKLNKVFNCKFLMINFCTFMLGSLVILSCLLFGLFFSSFKVLSILFMGICLGVIYLFYTIELFKIIDYNFKKYSFEKLKNNSRDFSILSLINGLCIVLISNLFYLFNYFYALVFVFVVLVNLILFNINQKYLRKKI